MSVVHVGVYKLASMLQRNDTGHEFFSSPLRIGLWSDFSAADDAPWHWQWCATEKKLSEIVLVVSGCEWYPMTWKLTFYRQHWHTHMYTMKLKTILKLVSRILPCYHQPINTIIRAPPHPGHTTHLSFITSNLPLWTYSASLFWNSHSILCTYARDDPRAKSCHRASPRLSLAKRRLL